MACILLGVYEWSVGGFCGEPSRVIPRQGTLCANHREQPIPLIGWGGSTPFRAGIRGSAVATFLGSRHFSSQLPGLLVILAHKVSSPLGIYAELFEYHPFFCRMRRFVSFVHKTDLLL